MLLYYNLSTRLIVLSWLNANPARHNSTWTTKQNIEQTLPAQLRNPNIFIFASRLNPTRAAFMNASMNESFMPPGLCRLLIKQREHTETSLPTLRASTTKEATETTAFLDPNLKYQSKRATHRARRSDPLFRPNGTEFCVNTESRGFTTLITS